MLPQNRVRRVIKQDPDVHAAQKQAVKAIGAATSLFISFFAEQAAAKANGKRLQYRHFSEVAAGSGELQFCRGIVPQQQTLASVLARRKEAGTEGEGKPLEEMPEEAIESDHDEQEDADGVESSDSDALASS